MRAMIGKTKSELLNAAEKEFEKPANLIGPIDANSALGKGDEDTSIKDIIAHRAHRIEFFLG